MMDDGILSELLQRLKPILLGTYEKIDPAVPGFLSILRKSRAPECYHKHSTFFDHLLGVYRILKIWNAPDPVARCGLFHSSYSNSYVNLALFKPDVERQDVRDLIGDEAEELVHMFCIVPRQELMNDMVLLKYDHDEELDAALKDSENSWSDGGSKWRRKLQEILPPEGLVVKHIRTGDDLRVPRRLIAIFLLLTMADYCDQLFGYQDILFDNSNGRLEYRGNNWKALWPGGGKPGLWMNFVSRLGAIYNMIVREEKEFRKDNEGRDLGFENIEFVIPPVFNNCRVVLSTSDELQARDLYWEVICMKGDEAMEEAEPLLLKACMHNPFIGEPHLVLAQIYLSHEKYMKAEEEAKVGLKLLLEWGTCWDKRVTWEAWISWGRVMLDNAKENTWPQTAFGIINLGLVK